MAGVVDNKYNEPEFAFLTAGVESKATSFHQQQGVENKATSFHQQWNGYVPNSCILLDNQSMIKCLLEQEAPQESQGNGQSDEHHVQHQSNAHKHHWRLTRI